MRSFQIVPFNIYHKVFSDISHRLHFGIPRVNSLCDYRISFVWYSNKGSFRDSSKKSFLGISPGVFFSVIYSEMYFRIPPIIYFVIPPESRSENPLGVLSKISRDFCFP